MDSDSTMDPASTANPASTTDPVSTTASTPRLTGTNIWACNACKAHLAFNHDFVSRNFYGRFGRAYLFKNVNNIRIAEPKTARLVTGMHDISLVSCETCDNYLGWKYIAATQYEQSYKLGHFLLEKTRIVKDGEWV